MRPVLVAGWQDKENSGEQNEETNDRGHKILHFQVVECEYGIKFWLLKVPFEERITEFRRSLFQFIGTYFELILHNMLTIMVDNISKEGNIFETIGELELHYFLLFLNYGYIFYSFLFIFVF